MAEKVWLYDPGRHAGFGATGVNNWAEIGRYLYYVLLKYRTTGLAPNQLAVEVDPSLTHGICSPIPAGDLLVHLERIQLEVAPADWTTLGPAELDALPALLHAKVVEQGGDASTPSPLVSQWAAAFASTPVINPAT